MKISKQPQTGGGGAFWVLSIFAFCSSSHTSFRDCSYLNNFGSKCTILILSFFFLIDLRLTQSEACFACHTWPIRVLRKGVFFCLSINLNLLNYVLPFLLTLSGQCKDIDRHWFAALERDGGALIPLTPASAHLPFWFCFDECPLFYSPSVIILSYNHKELPNNASTDQILNNYLRQTLCTSIHIYFLQMPPLVSNLSQSI